MQLKNHKIFTAGLTATAAVLLVSGCGSQRATPVSMAPPIQPPPPANVAPDSARVFNWREVPQNERIPVTRAVFDQKGYQIFTRNGETIVVPFENENLQVMKFGRADEQYFVNDGESPTLYVTNGGYLENASAQNAKWYPFSQDFKYERPVYVGIAPSWPLFLSMGWYPGMTAYGGYWGYTPYGVGLFTPMIGLNFNIGGNRYNGWDNYSRYSRSNPQGRTYNRVVYNNNYQTAGSFNANRAASSAGSFKSTGSYSSSNPSSRSGASSRGFGTGSGSFSRSNPSGSFGSSSRNNFGTSSGSGRSSFGSGSYSGSFGGSSGFGSSSRSSGSSFGSSRPGGYSGSFGSGSSSRPSGSSFGSGSSSSFGSPRSSFGSGSSSFGSGRSSFGSGSSSFGSGRSSFGSGSSSFGSGRSSFGSGRSSFGGGRRR